MVTDPTRDLEKTLTVGSPAFSANGEIPREYTADGEDVSPEITIADWPDETRFLALVVDDPDAARGSWTHWLAWDLPVERGGVKIERGEALGERATIGTNDFGDVSWGGPAPPSGTHRYRFRAFALREPLGLHDGAYPIEVLRALEGKALAWGELVATYSRAKPARQPRA